jgi:lysozyme-related protein Hpa2
MTGAARRDANARASGGVFCLRARLLSFSFPRYTIMRLPSPKPAFALMLVCLCARPAGVRAESRDCFAAAAAYQHVSPIVLRAIAWQESHGNANAIHRNRNGSTDYGIMQINSVHLPVLSRYGVGADDLMNPCLSIFVAAWHLHKMMVKYGNTWAAVGAYHSERVEERDRYARAIEGIVGRMVGGAAVASR